MVQELAIVPRKPIGDVPPYVRVVCGDQLGNFDVKRMCIIMDGNKDVSPTEFERLAGKAASKKWKASIRVDKVRSLTSQCMSAMLLFVVTHGSRSSLVIPM
jgi:hypothetical protein